MKGKIRTVLAAAAVLLLCLLPHTNTDSIIKISQNDNGNDFFGGFLRKGSVTRTAAAEDDFVYLGGYPMGIVVNANGIIVLGSTEVLTDDGRVHPLKDADIRCGDVITEVGGVKVNSLYMLRRLINAGGKDVMLTVERGGAPRNVTVTPADDRLSGERRLGLLAKEDIAGVGTMTFTTEKGAFAGLGHRIADGESGLFRELCHGKIVPADIDGVIKGERGKAGGLVSSVNRLQQASGEIYSNTEIGLYGEYKGDVKGEKIRVARAGEARMGAAKVLATVDGSEPKLYDIDIVKVVDQNEKAEKGLVISVRDKQLIDKAGGIVQGMSGSPIIQDGVLVGAVTHVFVSDPERGYGVHARFMLDKAREIERSLPVRDALLQKAA